MAPPWLPAVRASHSAASRLPCVLVALCGGVGAARLLAGVDDVVEPAAITAVVNTGDDLTLHGLHISPDIDTIIYTLAGMANPQTGWGIEGETWKTMEELKTLGGTTWFQLGDRDLATHLYRTQRLAEGATLSQVTAELASKRGLEMTVVPMSDDQVRTRVRVSGQEVPFQDYFVRLRHDVAVEAIRFDGAETSRPAPGVLEALAGAELIVCCPSNPLVSIGPILAVPGIKELVASRRDAVVAVSPIVAGAALKGPAARLLGDLGHEISVVGVARLYADWVGTLIIDEADASLRGAVEQVGMRCLVTDTVMSSPERARRLAEVVCGARR